MKKLFCVSAALCVAVILVMANPVTGNAPDIKKKKESRWEPSRATAFAFSEDFPKAKYVTWSYGAFDEASFLDDDVIKTAYYDKDNNLVGTTTDMDADALTAKVRERINKMYPGYTIEKVVFFDDNEANETDMSLFNQSFEDEDNYFPLLIKGSKQIILKVTTKGAVSFFQNFK
jgi:hypothetical protein